MIRCLYFLMFLTLSCSCIQNGGNHRIDDHIIIYYNRSYEMSEMACSYDFHERIEKGGDKYRSIFDMGEIRLQQDEYNDLLNYVVKVKSQEFERQNDSLNVFPDIPFHFQATFYERDTLLHRVCIDYYNNISIDGELVSSNDTLIFLLRKYSHFYNYSSRDDLVVRELDIFGLPNDYKDLSRDSNLFLTSYNKVILKVE